MDHLSGVAMVTGAGGGIGAETCYSFAAAGVQNVVFADIDEPRAQQAAEESKSYAKHPEYAALVVGVDVVDEASVQAMVDKTVEAFGRIDYCVNCAGLGNLSFAPASDIKIDIFNRTIDVNVKGIMLCMRAVSKAMATQEERVHEGRRGLKRSLGRGSIINVASTSGLVAGPGMLAYTGSKHAVLGMTKVAALDNGDNKIRVNSVCPAFTITPMWEESKKRLPHLEDYVCKNSLAGRPAHAEEVAGVILFLCSPAASYVNGEYVKVDAGWTLRSAM